MIKETKGKTAQSIDNMFSFQQYLLDEILDIGGLL